MLFHVIYIIYNKYNLKILIRVFSHKLSSVTVRKDDCCCNSNENDRQYLLSIYYMPGSAVFLHVILIKTAKHIYCLIFKAFLKCFIYIQRIYFLQ